MVAEKYSEKYVLPTLGCILNQIPPEMRGGNEQKKVYEIRKMVFWRATLLKETAAPKKYLLLTRISDKEQDKCCLRSTINRWRRGTFLSKLLPYFCSVLRQHFGVRGRGVREVRRKKSLSFAIRFCAYLFLSVEHT